MRRMESYLDDAGAPYDRRARAYDRLVRSRVYNRVAWSTAPDEYADFAAAAIASSSGRLLEAAAGSAAATAALHAASVRETVLVDRSRAMLELAAQRIAAAGGAQQATAVDAPAREAVNGDGATGPSAGACDPAHPAAAAAAAPGEPRARIRFVQADILALPFDPHGFATVFGLGLVHLFDDVPALVAALRKQLRPDGRLFLAGLVAETRRGRQYLNVLHRAGEVARPRTAEELHAALGAPADLRTSGCMAYASLPAA
jgi:SAM-dependent methyltransferase